MRSFPKTIAKPKETPESVKKSLLAKIGEFEKHENLAELKGGVDIGKVYQKYFNTHPIEREEEYTSMDGTIKVRKNLIPEGELTPQGLSRRYFGNKHAKRISGLNLITKDEFANILSDMWLFANKKLDKSIDNLNKIKNENPKQAYLELRNIASWMEILADSEARKLKPDFGKELKLQANRISTRLQGLWSYIEDQSQTESIYLSGMYRKFGEGCSYLCSNEKKNELSLLLNFQNTIQKGNSNLYVLGYVNEKDELLDDPENSQKYKNYNKPKLSYVCFDSESTFNFPLHFGVNQSRKYFWNNVRGTQNNKGEKPKDKDGNEIENNQIHNIFNPNSRLKVSSMRLIRKHNPIRGVWEYYLSLAIYRLEEAKVNMDLSKSKSIVGVDFGENQLAAFTHSDLNGKYISSKNFDEKLTKHTLDLHTRIEKQIELGNYADPIIRKRLGNKLKSAMQKASSDILKLNLDNNIVVFEQDATGNRKHISSAKEGLGFKKTTLMKGFKLLERSKSKNQAEIKSNQILNSTPKTQDAAINSSDILGLVPTQLTSSICSQCGFTHANESKKSFASNLSKKVDLEKLKEDILSGRLANIVCIRDYISDYTGQKISEYEDLFVIDLTKNIADFYKGTTFEQEIQYFKNDYSIDNKTELPKCLISLFEHRPKWFEGDVETFRCLNCGHIEYRSCDRQASLNIARWRVFLESKKEQLNEEYLKISDVDKSQICTDFKSWYKEKINNWIS